MKVASTYDSCITLCMRNHERSFKRHIRSLVAMPKREKRPLPGPSFDFPQTKEIMNLQQNYNTRSIPGNNILEWLSLEPVKERFASTRRAEWIFRNSPFDPSDVKSATGFGSCGRCWLGHNKLDAADASISVQEGSHEV